MFLDQKNNQLDLKDFRGKLILLNFYYWCAPCKEEMPLDKLQSNKNFNNLEIFPINIGNDSLKITKIL